jgi:hypothetical protein
VCRKLKEGERVIDAGHETRMLGHTCSLPLTGAIGGDSLIKISKYLETHGWKKIDKSVYGWARGHGRGMTRRRTVGMPGRLVDTLLIGIEKGIDGGDDMPGLCVRN